MNDLKKWFDIIIIENKLKICKNIKNDKSEGKSNNYLD